MPELCWVSIGTACLVRALTGKRVWIQFSYFQTSAQAVGVTLMRKSRAHVARSQPGNLLSPEPCRWSPGLTPQVSPSRLTSFGLMMIDYGGFFITLNLISARSNLSNDCSLLAIAKFKSFFMPLHRQPVGRYWDASWFTRLFQAGVGIEASQSSVTDRKSWSFCRSYIAYSLGRKQWQFPLDQMWSSKRQFLLDLKAIQPFTEIPKFNKSCCFM